jgi:biopolymer transport protein ExbD
MSRRKKRKSNADSVELNLAAMLDMAFQLLTFFILTFKPAPVEGQITLRMPPPQSVTVVKGGKQAGEDLKSKDLLKGLNTLVISAFSKPGGEIGSLAIGEVTVGNLARLNDHLKTVLGDQSSPFDQVIIQAGSGLHYAALMSVVDVCTRQTLPNGQKLTKLSFVEVPEGG